MEERDRSPQVKNMDLSMLFQGEPEKKPNYYELLGVQTSDSYDKIRQAYDRMKKAIGDQVDHRYSMLSENEINAQRLQIKEAFNVLVHPRQRAEYDRKIGLANPTRDYSSGKSDGHGGQGRNVESSASANLSNKIHANASLTEDYERTVQQLIEQAERIDGSVFRQIRELCKLSLKDLQEVTKVNIQFLIAIEENQFEKLLGIVYTKGFLRAILKYMNVKQSEYFIQEFVKNIEAWKSKNQKH